MAKCMMPPHKGVSDAMGRGTPARTRIGECDDPRSASGIDTLTLDKDWETTPKL